MIHVICQHAACYGTRIVPLVILERPHVWPMQCGPDLIGGTCRCGSTLYVRASLVSLEEAAAMELDVDGLGHVWASDDAEPRHEPMPTPAY